MKKLLLLASVLLCLQTAYGTPFIRDIHYLLETLKKDMEFNNINREEADKITLNREALSNLALGLAQCEVNKKARTKNLIDNARFVEELSCSQIAHLIEKTLWTALTKGNEKQLHFEQNTAIPQDSADRLGESLIKIMVQLDEKQKIGKNF
jgi:hypothetical protein